MTFILKQILWNTAKYHRPSGVKANSGYPKENGFGHEEWNNSERLRFQQDGKEYCAFHTEGIGNLANTEKSITVFMYASHDRVQELVGIAGNAIPLMADGKSRKRSKLAKKLSVNEFSDDAWSVPTVQHCFDRDYAKFISVWNEGKGSGWIPNWIAPADQYLWLNPPVRLDPSRITGKTKLQTRFKSHTELTSQQAATVMDHIPMEQRNAIWRRIYSGIQGDASGTVDVELQDIWDRNDITPTTKDALVKARLGQERFRLQLEQRWGSSCAVTGCAIRDVLRASHIKPWAISSDSERLDPANGLLLIANLDCLFDRGAISFSDQGKMLVTDNLSRDDRAFLGVPADLRLPLTRQESEFLAYHRTHKYVDKE